MIYYFLNILEQSLLYLPLILGAYCSMSLMRIPNLAIESAFLFGAILSSKILYSGDITFFNLIISILLSILGGTIVGIIFSFIIIKTKLSQLLSSIITIGIFSGINLYILGSSHLSIVSNYLNLIPVINQYPAMIILFLLTLIIIMLFFLFLKTELGISCAIFGNNSKFFEKYNISKNYIFIVGICLSNALAGISGFFIAQTNGFVDISMGYGISLFCITALMIGRSISRSNYPISILMPLLGIILYFLIQQILLKLGFDLRYFAMVQAIIILIKIFLLKKDKIVEDNQLGI